MKNGFKTRGFFTQMLRNLPVFHEIDRKSRVQRLLSNSKAVEFQVFRTIPPKSEKSGAIFANYVEQLHRPPRFA
jgi:hypothetical protein